MRPCRNSQELLSAPIQRWCLVGGGIVWCHSLTLCGAAVWGQPGPAEARELMELFGHYGILAPRFDVLLDGSAVDTIDHHALAITVAWLQGRVSELEARIRARVGVIPRGLTGFALAGISPAVGIADPVRVVTDARDGFRHLLPDGGDALCDEVTALIAQARGVSAPVLALRRLLAESYGAIDLAAAARGVGLSTRSLQRELGSAGLSFRSEQADARFRAAEELLRSDDKLATVAAHLGLSEDGLTTFVRARTGLTAGELRRRLRGA